MADKSPGILETMGMASGFVMMGAAGKELYKEYDTAQQARSMFDSANKAVRPSAVREVTRSLADAGLTKEAGLFPTINKRPEPFNNIESLRTFLENTGQYGKGSKFEHTQFLNEVSEFAKELTALKQDYSFVVHEKAGSNYVVDLMIGSKGNQKRISFDTLTKGGRIASTKYGVSYRIPRKFINQKVYNQIISNEPFDINNLGMSYNAWIAQEQRYAFKANQNPRAAVKFARQFIVNSAVPTMDNPLAKLNSNMMVPAFRNSEGELYIQNIMDNTDDVALFWKRLQESTGKDFYKYMGFLNAKQQSHGIVMDPKFFDPKLFDEAMSAFGEDALIGAKYNAQLFKEAILPAELSPKTFNAPFVKINGVKSGNVINLPTWYDEPKFWQDLRGVEDSKSLLDEVLLSGYGTGVKEAGISGHEAAIISTELARKKLTTFHTKNIDIMGDISKTGIEGLIDEVFRLNYRISHKYTQATLYSNQYGSKNIIKHYSDVAEALMTEDELKQINSIFGDNLDILVENNFRTRNYKKVLNSLSPEQMKQYQNIRNQVFTRIATPDAANKTKVKKILSKVGGLRYSGTITDTDFGPIKLGKYGDEKIFDIIGGGEKYGFRLETRSVDNLGNSFKTWWSRKITAAKYTRNARRLFTNMYGLQTEIYNAGDKAAQAAKANEIFNLLQSGNFKELDKIVKKYKHNISPEILEIIDKIIYSSEGIRKLDPQNIHMNLQEAYAQLGLRGPDFAASDRIQDKIAAHKQFIQDKINNSVLPEQKAKWKVLFDSYLGNEEGNIAPGLQMGNLYSVGDPLSMSGVGKDTVNLNVDMAHKFEQYDMPSLHKRIVQNFNREEYQNLYNAYEPFLLKQRPRNAAIIKANEINPANLDALFGDIRTDADILNIRKLAGEIFTVNNPGKTVSDKTRYLIELSEDITIPILDFHSSSFIGKANLIGENQGQEAISKILSSQSKKAVQIARGDISGIELDDALTDLRTTATKILADTSIFTKQPVRGTMLENRPSEAFNVDLLKEFEKDAIKNNKLNEFNAILQKSGIESIERLDKTRIAGLSTEDYEKFITNSDEYASALKNNTGDESLFRSEYIAKERLRKQYGYGGRHPGGYGAYEIIDAQQTLEDLYKLQGMTAEQARKEAMMRARKGGIYGNTGFESVGQLDYDRDIVSLVRASGPQERKEIAEFLSKTGSFPMDKLNKGGIKADFRELKNFSDIEKLISERIASGAESAAYKELQSSMASTFAVGQVSNKMLDLKGFGKVDQDAIFLADILREQTIGSKGGIGQNVSTAKDFLETVFDTTNKDYSKRAKQLKETILNTESFKMSDGNNYFQAKYKENLDDFLRNLLKGYDTYANTNAGQLEHWQRKIKWTKYISEAEGRGIINAAQESNFSKNIGTDLFSDTAQRSMGKTRRGINTIQNTIQAAGSKILRNKVVQIAGGVALASYLLRSPDSAVKNQDIREQAQPKRKSLAGAEVIDPKVGSVYQAAPAGYNFQVRGKMPKNVDSRQIQHQMSMLGIPIHGSIINRDPAVDAGYVNQIHKDNNSLLWNYK